MENENKETVVKTYTQEELESYADRRVNDAMKTARKKFDNEKQEAERLASMTAEEKIAEREKALAERERQISLLENKNEAMKTLAEKGISAGLVDLVVADTAEDMKAKIDILAKEFDASVQKEIEKRLSGQTPRKVDNKEAISKDDFHKMTLAEQSQIYNTNPNLWKALNN